MSFCRMIILAVLMALILSGCNFTTPVKLAPDYHYTITQWPQKTAVARKTKSISTQTLLVTTPVAAPGYASSRMIYVMIPYQLKSFANHRWIAPPSQLILPLIANQLRATHYFHAVVTP